MVKIEISFAGAGDDERREFAVLMQKVVDALGVAAEDSRKRRGGAADYQERLKKKILDHICYRDVRVGDELDREFWEVDIQGRLNPKDRANLRKGIQALCDEGYLEDASEGGTYYLTNKGYDAIY